MVMIDRYLYMYVYKSWFHKSAIVNLALITGSYSRSISSSFRNSHTTLKRKNTPSIFKGANSLAANCL